MDIISLEFAGLTIASVLIYYLIGYRFRIGYLTLLSCAFIASFNLLLLPYVLLFTIINYYIGLKLPDSGKKLLLYRTGLVINVVQLILLKYASFVIDPFFTLFGSAFEPSRVSAIIVPIGISYFTLQGIGYLVNIKMGWEKPEKNVFDFLLYITFFPKFLSGPIERSNHFLPQLKEKKVFKEENLKDGLRIALFGFLKKVAIANQIAPFVFDSFNELGVADGSAIWILVLLLPIYLYFDFSGYTDIAIGFAKMFGIELLPNFNRPFFSENMTIFWKRFHISLSAWFGDYIYKLTVFKRRKWGNNASVYAVFITWILFGIWHGAGWNFMLLGFLQALAINYEFFTKKIRFRLFSKLPVFIRPWVGRFFTYVFYGLSLVFFFSPDIDSTFTLYSRIFTFETFQLPGLLLEIPLSALILIFLFLGYELISEDFNVAFEKISNIWWKNRRINVFLRWTLYSTVLAIIYVLGNQAQQFIYVQF